MESHFPDVFCLVLMLVSGKAVSPFVFGQAIFSLISLLRLATVRLTGPAWGFCIR